MSVIVEDYQPIWKHLFITEAAKIRAIIAGNEVAILHVGSTSVEGLAAKPIIDLLVIVESILLLDDQATDFLVLGYEGLGEYGLAGRRYFQNDTYHIHAYQYDNIEEIQRHVAFRNYLRDHSDVMNEYGLLKKQLAARYLNDRAGYQEAKAPFIKEHEKKALQYAWQKER